MNFLSDDDKLYLSQKIGKNLTQKEIDDWFDFFEFVLSKKSDLSIDDGFVRKYFINYDIMYQKSLDDDKKEYGHKFRIIDNIYHWDTLDLHLELVYEGADFVVLGDIGRALI